MKRALLCPAMAFLLGACSQVHEDPIARGKAYFASYECRKCHRVGRTGADLGPDLSAVGFRKSAIFLDAWLKDPKAWKAGAAMPNFYFPDRVRKDLVAYLASLKGWGPGEPKPWSGALGVEKGALLYRHAGCVTCHGADGAGGYPNNNVVGGEIPSLTAVADGFSRDELIGRISEGVLYPIKADPSGPDPLLSMPRWSETLSAEEIGAVADYLLALKPAAGEGSEW